MPYIENIYSELQQEILLQTAALSIQHGLKHQMPLQINVSQYEEALQDKRATFVTLEKQNQLRGCIGTLKALKPLVEDVSNNAYSAAFNDPRFPPLQTTEFNELEIHISILTPAQPFPVEGEADLLSQLNPGEDGLILHDGVYQSTFLPSVWESLTSPQAFLNHLKQKAGLPSDYWSDTIQFERYQTISFGNLVTELSLENALN